MNPRILVLLLGGLSACGGSSASDAPHTPPRVVVSFYPLAFLARSIGGEGIEVHEPLPPGEDPAFWNPSPEALLEFQTADLILLNGAGFERWAKRASLPESRVVRTAEAFRDEWIELPGTTHAHGGLAPHRHEGIDGHTWMDPVLFARQARAVRDALRVRWPEASATFDRGYEALLERLSGLEQAWRDCAKALAGRTVVASHPSYLYPARRFGIELVSVDLDPSHPLPSAALERLAELRSGERPVVVLWESEPVPEVRATLADLGIRSAVVSPDETSPPEGDFVTHQRAQLAELVAAVD